jgi:predicted thioesterase
VQVHVDADVAGGERCGQVRVPAGGWHWRRGGHDWHRTDVPLEPGLCAEIELVVTDADTAIALKSGDVPVLGTPRVLALAEEASVKAIAPHLEAGDTTVGTRVELSHVAPVAVGSTVVAEATLEKCEGRRLVFTVSVSDDNGLVAVGKITRSVVQVKPFMEKAR